MATLLENLKTRRDAVGVELAALSNKSDQTRKQVLYEELTLLKNHIAQEEAPTEIYSRAVT